VELIVSEPNPLETLTMRAAVDLRSSGKNACVTASTPKTFVSQMVRTSSFHGLILVATGSGDRSVVDEDVESAECLVDPCHSGIDRSLIRHIDLDGMNIRGEVLRGRLASFSVARAEQHGEAARREVGYDLKPDTLVGTGNKGDAGVGHDVFLLLLRRPADGHGRLSVPCSKLQKTCTKIQNGRHLAVAEGELPVRARGKPHFGFQATVELSSMAEWGQQRMMSAAAFEDSCFHGAMWRAATARDGNSVPQ
jgi:hypothetical protein